MPPRVKDSDDCCELVRKLPQPGEKCRQPRAAAQRRLPPFLFHYIDGGAYAEHTLKRNVADLADIALRQRVLKDMAELSLETRLFDEALSMPVALSPVGLTGMYARRGEVQAARAAARPSS